MAVHTAICAQCGAEITWQTGVGWFHTEPADLPHMPIVPTGGGVHVVGQLRQGGPPRKLTDDD